MNDQGTGGLRSFREAESAEQIGGAPAICGLRRKMPETVCSMQECYDL